MKILIILLLSLSAIFAYRNDAEEEYVTIDNALKTFTKVVIEYDEKLDHSAKFPELQAAIDAIAASMQNYKGRAQGRLPVIEKYNTDARVNYASCVKPVYEWCVGMNFTLDVFIKYIDEGMAVKDRRIAWNLAGRLLRQGLSKTTTSLSLLEDVQKTMGYLETELKHLLIDLNYDFSPDGEYGKIRADLLNQTQHLQDAIAKENQNQENARARHKSQEEVARQRESQFSIGGILGKIFRVVISVVLCPIGQALGLPALFHKFGLGHLLKINSNTGIPDAFDYERSAAVINDYEKRRQVIDDQVKSIQLLFNSLNEKTQQAVNIAGEVKTALEREAIHLHSLKGLIQAAESNRVALLSDNDELRRDLIPSFRALGDSCSQYAVRHGYSLKASQSAIAQRRRRAVDQCQENKEMYANMLLNSAPFNATPTENDKDTAMAIVENMQCGTVSLLTANWNHSDTSANNNVKIGEFADEPSKSIFLGLIKNIPKSTVLLNI